MNVVIIGSGVAGLMAAEQIAGMPGVQLDIISTGAGASPYIHGFNIPLYEQDSIEVFMKDTLESGYYLSNPDLIECLCQDSVKLLPELERMGIELEKKNGSYVLLKPLGSTFPRVASSGNHTGVDILNRLRSRLESCKTVHFHKNTRALKIFVKDNKPAGVAVYHERIGSYECLNAQCIIMACGGYSGIYPFSTNSSDIGGDGIAMAYQAGIPLIDMEFIQFEPSVALYPEGVIGKSVITTMFYEGAVLRNRNGKRFMKASDTEPGECVNKDVLSKAIYEEILKGDATEHGGVYFDATGVGKKKLEESYSSYVKRYRDVGMDITAEPFEIAPAPHTSLGGVMIDKNCSTNIPGIFAAGEIIGGLHGANRIGGNAGLETLVFGKKAGVEAGHYLLGVSGQNAVIKGYDLLKEETAGAANIKEARLKEFRTEMQRLLADNFYVIREGSKMEPAKIQLKMMMDELKASKAPAAIYQKLRLENDLTCAWLLASAACYRTESVGCHVRKDHSDRDCHYHVILKKEQEELKIYQQSCKEKKVRS